MKMFRYIAYALVAVAACSGLTACDDDPEMPPVYYPVRTGDGSAAYPYSVGEAMMLVATDQAPKTGVFVQGVVTEVAEFNAAYGNITYNITDPDGTGYEFEVYRGLGLFGEKFTSITDINVGDHVVVYCTLTEYNGTIETAQGAQLVSLNGSEYPREIQPAAEGEGTGRSPYNVRRALEVITSDDCPETDVYIKGVVCSISEIGGSYGNATYYIQDEGYRYDKLYVYRGKGLDGANMTASSLKVGDEVVIYGQVVYYNNSTPEVTTGSIIVSLNGSPYETSDPIYQGLNGNIDGWTVTNINVPEGIGNIWEWSSQYRCLVGKAFINNNRYATDVIISREFDLEGITNAHVSFQHCYRYASNPRQIYTVVARETGSADWQTFTIPTFNDGSTFTFTNSGSIDLSEFDGKKVEIGFRYTSNTSDAGTWEIKSFNLFGDM